MTETISLTKPYLQADKQQKRETEPEEETASPPSIGKKTSHGVLVAYATATIKPAPPAAWDVDTIGSQ